MPAMVELLIQTAEADTDLLIRNREQGDDLSVAREVDFLLRAPTAEKAQLVADFINEFHYGEAFTESAATGHRISVRIVMPITQHVLCSASGFMACLSKLYDLEYDGWGSVIQNGS
jgi:hypothetical protein